MENLYIFMGTGRCTAHTFSSSMCIFYAAARLCFFSGSGRPFCCYHHNAIYTKNQVSVHYFCTLRQFCAGLAATRRKKKNALADQAKAHIFIIGQSNIEAGLTKNIIPMGHNIFRTAFNNFHDSRQGTLRYLGIIVCQQAAASFRNPYFRCICIRCTLCNVNMHRFKRVSFIRPKENNITEQAKQTRHSQSRLPENSALRDEQPT